MHSKNYYKYYQKLQEAIKEYNIQINNLKYPIIISKDVNEMGAKCFYLAEYKIFKKIYFKETLQFRHYYEVVEI